MRINDGSFSAPAYKRLSQHLRSQIEAGALIVGDKLPSFEQLAVQFNTHKVAVKRALGDLERDGLIETRPRSGTYVRKAFNKRTVKQIALLSGEDVETRNESYWMRMLQGMHEASCAEHAHVVLVDKKRSINYHLFDGVLYNVDVPSNHPSNLPCVVLGGSDRGHNSVSTDDFEGGRIAAEHLIGLGHRRIAYLAFHTGTTIARRRAGVQYAMEEAGIVPEVCWFRSVKCCTSVDEPGVANVVRNEMRDWLASGWMEAGCTAILAQNDMHAVGIYRALEEAGLKVPADISVVGFDDLMESQLLSPALTTVRVPLQSIGKVGIERLMAMIENPQASDETIGILFDPQLRVRDSTQPPRR